MKLLFVVLIYLLICIIFYAKLYVQVLNLIYIILNSFFIVIFFFL